MTFFRPQLPKGRAFFVEPFEQAKRAVADRAATQAKQSGTPAEPVAQEEPSVGGGRIPEVGQHRLSGGGGTSEAEPVPLTNGHPSPSDVRSSAPEPSPSIPISADMGARSSSTSVLGGGQHTYSGATPSPTEDNANRLVTIGAPPSGPEITQSSFDSGLSSSSSGNFPLPQLAGVGGLGTGRSTASAR